MYSTMLIFTVYFNILYHFILTGNDAIRPPLDVVLAILPPYAIYLDVFVAVSSFSIYFEHCNVGQLCQSIAQSKNQASFSMYTDVFEFPTFSL